MDSVEDYARHWAKHDSFRMGEECGETVDTNQNKQN